MGTLYIISTPIGNLEDISFRAYRMLKTAKFILCEDTRKTASLLRLLDEKLQDTSFNLASTDLPRLVSYYEQNEKDRIPEVINALKQDQDMVLVSDAGTPGISDPGFRIVRECIKEGIKVEAVPGASAVLSALVVSGLPTDKFLFVGYPPQKPGHRVTFFTNIKNSLDFLNTTVIFYEAPHKLIKTLIDVEDVFGDIELVVARELTKKFEQVKRDRISSLLTQYKKNPPKGEFVVLFHKD